MSQTQIDKDLKVAYDLLNRRKLRWCSGGVCACMGCANSEINKAQWNRIIEIPEIKMILERKKAENQAQMKQFIQRLRDRQL
jgi:hypothetical protein